MSDLDKRSAFSLKFLKRLEQSIPLENLSETFKGWENKNAKINDLSVRQGFQSNARSLCDMGSNQFLYSTQTK